MEEILAVIAYSEKALALECEDDGWRDRPPHRVDALDNRSPFAIA